jgi:hypothetical protein
MRAEDLFHTGHVVDDLDAAMRWYSEAGGYKWCEIMSWPLAFQTPGGEMIVHGRWVYSMSEPRLELVEAVPGTIWTTSASGVHHLGYWSNDIDRDIAMLIGSGAALEAKAVGRDGTTQWAYCARPAIGPRIELINVMGKPWMTNIFATGRVTRLA